MQQVQQQGYNLQTWKYSHEIVLFYVFDVNILWLSVLMHIEFFLMETISEYQKLGVINFVLTLYKKLLFLNIYLIKRIGFFKIILILTQYFGQINILQSFECTKLILYRGFVSAESCTSVVIAVFKWQCSRLSKLESF